MAKKIAVLIVLDGWGIGRNDHTNPVFVEKPPTFAWLAENYPLTSLQASGIAVGLPWGETGNSEVGHLTLGAGKVVYQYYPKITMAIQDGTFFENAVLKAACAHARESGGAINFAGLLTKANVHASLEHLRALIKMAQDEPNIKLTVNRATVQGQSDQITSALDGTQPYFTYGITVEVTPRINTSSNITVTIKPELSSKINEKTAPDGNTFPIIDKKSVETIFSLADGCTAAIGGLITTSDSDTSSKVPLLGDIPYLGEWLFSYKGRTKSQTEVLIFVTVRLIDPQADMDAAQLPSETSLYTKQHPVDSALYMHSNPLGTNAAAAKAP